MQLFKMCNCAVHRWKWS